MLFYLHDPQQVGDYLAKGQDWSRETRKEAQANPSPAAIRLQALRKEIDALPEEDRHAARQQIMAREKAKRSGELRQSKGENRQSMLQKEKLMKTIELIAEVDARHQLQATLPNNVLPGKVRVIVLTPEPDEDGSGRAWMAGVSHEWASELLDPREDIYSLEDGEPIHAAR